MIDILVVAGTGDSTAFLAELPSDIRATATVVSDVGAACVPRRDNVDIHVGILEEDGFRALIAAKKAAFLVDMSHPFAVNVHRAAQAGAAKAGIPYLRYERPGTDTQTPFCRRFPSFDAAALALNDIEGNILLTVGSKTIPIFQRIVRDFEKRCYLRVLTSSAVMKELEEAGIDCGHVFAMKGVASAALNVALAKEIDAKVLVSKNSGLRGGLQEKLTAAATLKIPLFLVEPPSEHGGSFTDFRQILEVIYG